MNKFIDVSIIIVNHNTKKLLHDCLSSIIENTSGLAYEIIVVDNASTDGSQDMVRNEFAPVALVCSDNNSGFAKANNRGIKIAKGKYILLLNSDTIVHPNCLPKTIEFANAEQKAGIIGCKIFRENKSLQPSCWFFPGVISELAFFTLYLINPKFDLIHRIAYMHYWKYDSIRKVDCVSGCFMLIKKTVFDEIGLLDEDFFMFYEDSEFCRRMFKKSKLRTYFFPGASITHLGGGSSKDISKELREKIFREWFLSARMYIRKCKGRLVSRFFVLLCLTAWICERSMLRLLQLIRKSQSSALTTLSYFKHVRL